jgi:acetyltransferase-like isoleucine patch superfamily enzyme
MKSLRRIRNSPKPASTAGENKNPQYNIQIQEVIMDHSKRRDMEMAYISDDQVFEEQKRCRRILQRLNFMDRSDFDGIQGVVQELLGASTDAFINPPFYCDYGKHISVGHRFFANFNLTILDEAFVTFGDDCFIGPNVSIYTACHSTDPIERNSRKEWALPVHIGNNVWIGGSTTILPGVTIGNNVTIGAGSVVVKDIPSGSVAVGNPCKVVKKIDGSF